MDPHQLAAVQHALREYRDRGALVAADDWGSGYSDSPPRPVEPEIVKVDMAVVHYLDSARHRALRRPVLAGRPGGRRVCAEGIEDPEQLERLRGLGVHLGQGFHLGVPELARPTPGGDRSRPPRRGSNAALISVSADQGHLFVAGAGFEPATSGL